MAAEILVGRVEDVPGHTIYELQHRHGKAVLTFENESRWACISYFEVDIDHRRKGIGQMLLVASFHLAQELDASLYYGSFVSPAAVRSALNAFGPDIVHVDHLGTFSDSEGDPNNRAMASVWHRLTSYRPRD